jgi:hypothetical protein
VQPFASFAGTPSVDSSAFRKRAPRVQLSEDPDTATQQTVNEMCRQIHQAAGDHLVQRAARAAVATYKGGPGWVQRAGDLAASNDMRVADSCWWWCKYNLKFKHHGEMFSAWASDLGDPATKLQLLIAPDVLVRMKRREGDCAIYTMMLCALLEACGVQWQIVTAAVDGLQPSIFSHVFVRAAGESLDASHGAYPGWQVPSYDLHRVWVFDSNGRRVSESAGGFSGLHAYRRRGLGADESDQVDFGGDSYQLPYYPIPSNGGTFVDQSTGQPYGGAAYTVPPKGTSEWSSLASILVKGGLDLARINAIQPGTVVSKDGAILRQNPGYAVGSPTSSLNLGGGISPITIGLGVVALLVLMPMFTKGGR